MITRGEVDFAAWRKRKDKRESGSLSSMFRAQAEAAAKPRHKKFDYVDPVEDMDKGLLEVPMTNLYQMKFHEMKVEKGVYTIGSAAYDNNDKPTDKTNSQKAQK